MVEQATEKFILSDEVKKEIDQWLLQYPQDQKQSAVVAALLATQKQNGGWLSKAAMEAVAEYLALEPIVVYEAASFYDMTNVEPIGKNKISLCVNVACMLRGSDELGECIKKRLQIDYGQTTADGKFTLKAVECMAACVDAPMCQINDRHYHGDLTPESMLALIDKLEQGEGDA